MPTTPMTETSMPPTRKTDASMLGHPMGTVGSVRRRTISTTMTRRASSIWMKPNLTASISGLLECDVMVSVARATFLAKEYDDSPAKRSSALMSTVACSKPTHVMNSE